MRGVDRTRRRTSRALGIALGAGLALTACSDASSTAESSSTEQASSEPASADATTVEPSVSESADASNDLILDVEFGDRRIHVACFGPIDEAVPTVLFEAGGGAPSDTWDRVVDVMAPTRRVCSYDRAGLGASPTAPEPRRTNKHLVADLEKTLELAGIEGPFVLVGHSMAVMPLTVYTAGHREDVSGVVLVDPRAPDVSGRFRAALPPPRDDEPEVVRTWREEDLGSFEHDPTMNPEHLDLTKTAAEASALLDPPEPFFGDVPVVVLGASETHRVWSDLPPAIARRFDRIWLEEQHALAEESSNGTFETVKPSGHEIQVEQPQAVIDAIESVLAAVAG